MIESASRTLRDGIAAVLARDFDSADQLLHRATTESPTDVDAWLWRAVASPTPAEGIMCLRRVLVFAPTHAEALQGLARLLAAEAAGLVASGQLAEGTALAREAVGLAPDCETIWISLATISQEPQERLDALRRAHDISPLGQTRALLRDALLHGAIATAGTNPDGARMLFREAAAVDPLDPRVWQALARMAANAAEALRALRELFKLVPDRPGIRTALKRALASAADTCAAAGSDGEALERWREALALDEQDATTWLGLATVTQDRDEALRALAIVRRAGLDDPRIAALTERWESESAAAFAPAASPAASPVLVTAPPPLAEAPYSPAAAFAPIPAADPAPIAATPESASDPFAAFAPPPQAPVSSFNPPPAAAPPPSSLSSFSLAPDATPAPPSVSSFSLAPDTTPPPSSLSSFSLAPDVTPPLPSVSSFSPAPAASTPASVSPFIAPSAAAPASIGVASAPARPAGAKRTVMIVDDSPTVRKILSMTLERAGYGVVSAADGEAALESLLTSVPDLILLDISMPKLDGYEVCKRVKADARTAHVPVVMLSGKDAFFDKVKGRMAGATEYLTKPFATPAVLAAVGRMFEPEADAAHG